MQATAGTDGQVLLFDTALFQEGTLVSAFAKLQAAPAGSDMMHLAWTSGQHLITNKSQHACTLCASAKIAQHSVCCLSYSPPQCACSYCSSNTLVGREDVAGQARIVRCCAHPIADIRAWPYRSTSCSHLQNIPTSPVACTDTTLVMATRSGIMASLKLEGCPMKETYGNAIPAAIIPATPTRIPHVSLLLIRPHKVARWSRSHRACQHTISPISVHTVLPQPENCFIAFAPPFWAEQSPLWGRGPLCKPFFLSTEYIDGAHVQLQQQWHRQRVQ